MDEILHEEEEPSSIESRLRPTKYLTIILALFIILAVALAVVVLWIGRSEPESSSPSDNPTLAILPFTNNTGDESLDFWENARGTPAFGRPLARPFLPLHATDRSFRETWGIGQVISTPNDIE